MIDMILQSWLFAYHVIFSLMAGCLGLLLVYLMTGGRWGLAAKPVLRAGAATAPWFFLFFLPIALGLHHIYVWTHDDHIATLHHKTVYFKPWFFILRSYLYLAYLAWVSRYVRRLMDEWTPDKPLLYYQTPGALNTLAFVLVMSFASFDWLMSLDPHWFSTIFGVLAIVGAGLSALALTAVSLHWLAPRLGKTPTLDESVSHDIGNLMLAFTMLWTYMSLSQYLIIWSANLPEEATWYAMRGHGVWRFYSIALFTFQFALPFLLLLSRNRKRDLSRLAKVGVWVLFMRVVESLWVIMPTLHHGEFHFNWTDPVMLLVAGALWFIVYRRNFVRELQNI